MCIYNPDTSRLFLACFALLLIIPAAMGAQAEYEVETSRHVYTSAAGCDLDLEVDLPVGKGPFPVIVYVHSWSGNLDQLGGHSMAMARDLGISGVRINYRKFSEGHSFNQARSDLLAALAFVRENSAQYRFDLKRLGIAGASAGAMLSSVVAQQTVECRVFIGFNGAYDLVNTGDSRFLRDERLRGILGGLDDSLRREASAAYQLKSPPPATLLMHGTADVVIDPEQSEGLAALVKARGGISVLKLFEGEKHGFFNMDEKPFPEVIAAMQEFLAAYLE